MLVVMKAQATPEEIQAVCDHIEQLGFRAHPLPGAQRTAIGITGNQGEVDRGNLEELSGVAEVIRVSKPYKLASRDVKEEDTVIRFAGTDAAIGGRSLAIVAGPCSIESREQAFAIAEQLAASGAQFFARNMKNFPLLKHPGRRRKPVLLKRGLSATLDEFLMAAEYIMSEGNY